MIDIDLDYLDAHLGPIEFLVVEFPAGARAANGFRRLLDLVDQHVIRVLDFEFFTRLDDGSTTTVNPREIATLTDFDLSVFAGASSGLLSNADFTDVAQDLTPGHIAGVLVYEELALLPVLAAWEHGGAVLLGEGSIDPDELLDALDTTELIARS